ncbi:unnamed protein product [Cuscuta campestris]|uniref:F-box domain-containing protein n=1 Tax=Cuscuta campestris TaxID=132261 RepID=A0A484MVJ9_9ASTE|nr:unnamed protein product [Cuscuta campestris]
MEAHWIGVKNILKYLRNTKDAFQAMEGCSHSDPVRLFSVLKEQQRDWMASQLSEQWKLMEEQVSRLANQLQDLQTQGSGSYQESGNSSNHNGGRNPFHFNPKIEFPSFEGGNPREWIKKCRQYFSLCKVPEEQQVNLASIHLKGRAEIWFSNYGQGRNNMCWDEFVMDLGARFKEDDHNDIVEEFNKLCQTGDLEEYVDKFEELKGLLLRKRPNMPQEYFLDSFIAGLKPQIKPFVKAFAPTSVTKAISYARLQEQTVEAWRTQDKSNKHSQLQSNMGRNNTPLLAKPESSAKSSTPTGYQGAFRPQGSYNTSSSANKPTFTQRNPKFIPASWTGQSPEDATWEWAEELLSYIIISQDHFFLFDLRIASPPNCIAGCSEAGYHDLSSVSPFNPFEFFLHVCIVFVLPLVEEKKNAFSELSDDTVLNTFHKLDIDPRNWARLSCVSTKFSSLIRNLYCESNGALIDVMANESTNPTLAAVDARVTSVSQALVQMQQDLETRFSRLEATILSNRSILRPPPGGHGSPSGSGGESNTGGRTLGYTPKPKLESPKCDGKDPVRWLYKAEEYFKFYDTPPDDRLKCVALMLEGPAADWFRWRMNAGLIDDWHDFTRKFKLRFDPLHFVDYIGQLAKLRQTTGVMEYQTEFERILLQHVTGASEETLISLFHAGLKQHLQHEICLLKPTSLSDSFALARELEAKHAALVTSVSQRQLLWNRSGSRGVRAVPPTLGVPSGLGKPATGLIKRLSRAEKMEKDAKGLCYNCDQKWSRDHKCGRFLFLMGDDEDDQLPVDVPDETMVVADISSLHSLTGVSSPRSLRLQGRVGKHEVQVLIDGGSTHNFVHPDLVSKAQLPVSAMPPFRVYVGNDDYLLCNKQCVGIDLELQGTVFTVDLFVLFVHGHDLVLGVQWLQQLGRVTHDYAALTMEFLWQKKTVRLQGGSPEFRTVSLNSLHALRTSANVTEWFELQFLGEIGQLNTLETTPSTSSSSTPTVCPAAIEQALTAYAAVFDVPSGLPPRRAADHRLFLQPGTAPVNAFEDLKNAMISTPVLCLPDFSLLFVVETDACATGIGAVLLQGEQPVAFFSKKLGPRLLAASTYHKELYAIVEAVQKWRQYLLGREFLIRTDQRSLKQLVQQVIQTPDQQFYVRKLLGFCFRIEYKTGASNKVADALSRMHEEDVSMMIFLAMSTPVLQLLEAIRQGNTTEPDLRRLHEEHARGEGPLPSVDALLTERTELLRILRSNLERAQQRMREMANKKRRELSFAVGDWVLLKLQPYRQVSVHQRSSHKLSRRYYGPFEVAARIGETAYRLVFPDHARIHPVFHVSLLKPYRGPQTPAAVATLPSDYVDGRPVSQPLRVLDYCTILVNGGLEQQALVEWTEGGVTEATWESVDDLRRCYPFLHLADKEDPPHPSVFKSAVDGSSQQPDCGWSLFDDLMFDTLCDPSELSRADEDPPSEAAIKRGSLCISKWRGCLHVEERRNYMLFRGIIKNFKQSRVWRTINDKNRKQTALNCAFCTAKHTWDLYSAFCLRRYFGFHEDGEQVVRAYVLLEYDAPYNGGYHQNVASLHYVDIPRFSLASVTSRS